MARQPGEESDASALARAAVRGGVWISAGSYVAFATNLLGTVVLTRFISPAEFGAYALAQSYNQIALAATSFAFTQGVIQAPRPLPALADTALLMTAGLRVLLVIASIPLAFAIGALNGATVGWLFIQLAVWQLIDAMKTAMGVTLERDMRFGPIAILGLVGSVSAMVIAIAVAMLRPGPWALVARDFAMSGVVLCGYLAFSRRWGLPSGRRFDRGTARYLWNFGKNIYVVRALQQLVLRLDRPLIGSAVSLEALGLYHQARYLASLPAVAVAPGNTRVAVATYSRIRDDPERTGRAFALVQYFVVRGVAPLALVFFAWPTEAVTFTFGEKWAAAAPALRVLAAFVVAYPSLESYRALFTAVEDWKTLRRSLLLQAGLLVSTFAFAAPRWGAAGAAWAALVSTVGGLLYSRRAARALLSARRLRGSFGVTVAAIAGILVATAVNGFQWASDAQRVLLGSSLACLAYAGVLVVLERTLLTSNVKRVFDLVGPRRTGTAANATQSTGAQPDA